MSLLAKKPDTSGAHEDSAAAFVPDQSRAERKTSYAVDDFAVPGGREEDWRFTPVDRLSGLFQPGATTRTSLVTSSFNGSSGAARMPNLNRNAFKYPKTWDLDLRASKAIKVHDRYSLEFLTEAFNLLNHQNVTGVGATAYSITEDTVNHLNTLVPYTSTPFGSITSTNNSNFSFNVRQIQMALRLKF